MTLTRDTLTHKPAVDFRPKGKNIFFGIGINTYQSSFWPKLNNAVRDVEAVAALLKLQYGFEDVIMLKDEKATAANIEDELYRCTDPSVIGPHDSLLLYYSGHGHLDMNDRGYWVPIDAEKGRISNYISNSRIRELIADIKCKHVLLISDACFSGSFFVGGVRKSNSDEVAEEYERRISRWAFCSGRHDEVVSDGPNGKHSPFAAAILAELSINTTQKLNIARLANKVIEITRSNYRQMPEANPIQDAGHGGGQFVFTPIAYTATETVTLDRNLPFESVPQQYLPVSQLERINQKVGFRVEIATMATVLISLFVGIFFRFNPTSSNPQVGSSLPLQIETPKSDSPSIKPAVVPDTPVTIVKKEPPKVEPKVAKIRAVTSAINLGEIKMGGQKEYEIALKNDGNIASSSLNLTIADANGRKTLKKLSGINAGSEKSYVLNFKPNGIGQQKLTLTIQGYAIQIEVSAKVVGGIFPPANDCEVTFKTSLIGTSVSFSANNKFYAATADASGIARFKVPCALVDNNEIVKVSWAGGNARNFELKPGIIVLPN